MPSVRPTAIEILKSFGLERGYEGTNFLDLLRYWAFDKGFRFHDIMELNQLGLFATLFSGMSLRSNIRTEDGVIAYLLRQSPNTKSENMDKAIAPYRGVRDQNAQIDSAFYSRRELINGFFGSTAADLFQLPIGIAPLRRILSTPIAIIGAGPSGAMMRYALISLGFQNVTIFDKAGKFGGIWNQKNVLRSRNNPRNITFQGISLPAAPGPGQSVYDFTSQALYSQTITKAHITSIVPGQLRHKIFYTGANGSPVDKTFPIVINCCGTGKPKVMKDPERMTTETTATYAGFRWQQGLKPDYNNESVVLIGLGNSTAEMLQQIDDLRQKGRNIDYKVLTHFPEEAVRHPYDTVTQKSLQGNEHTYRVFRDLAKPDLTSYAGDLHDLRRHYMVALKEGRIVPDVVSWERIGTEVRWKTRWKRNIDSVYCTELYTLIGYKMSEETYHSFGITTNVDGYANVDYDGEFQEHPTQAGLSRVFRGYFGLGPVLETPDNRNAIVIPGNIFRMGDLLLTLIFRCMEVSG